MKKFFCVLIAAAFVSLGVSAQDSGRRGQDYNKRTFPKNALGFDVVLPVAAAIWTLYDRDNSEQVNYGFGAALQYERRFNNYFSLAGRVSYVDFGGGVSVENSLWKVSVSSLSAEGNMRIYPFGRSFFVGGMLGYGTIQADIPIRTEDNQLVSYHAEREYIKYGYRLGWRFSSRRSGFIFEPSFGRDWGVGINDIHVNGSNLADNAAPANSRKVHGSNNGNNRYGHGKNNGLDSDSNEAFNGLENFLIFGPYFSIIFGWQF